jgi:hypothetical protein
MPAFFRVFQNTEKYFQYAHPQKLTNQIKNQLNLGQLSRKQNSDFP